MVSLEMVSAQNLQWTQLWLSDCNGDVCCCEVSVTDLCLCREDGEFDVSELGNRSCVTRFIKKLLSIVSCFFSLFFSVCVCVFAVF